MDLAGAKQKKKKMESVGQIHVFSYKILNEHVKFLHSKLRTLEKSSKQAVIVLIRTETERLNKLKKSAPELEKIWGKVPEATTQQDEDEEGKFKVLQGGNQANSKIFDMILNAKNKCRILDSEKDFMKFYHANFLEALEEREIDYKLLTPISKKSIHIFEDIDKSKIKKLCSSVKENLCFLIKMMTKFSSLSKMKETIRK